MPHRSTSQPRRQLHRRKPGGCASRGAASDDRCVDQSKGSHSVRARDGSSGRNRVRDSCRCATARSSASCAVVTRSRYRPGGALESAATVAASVPTIAGAVAVVGRLRRRRPLPKGYETPSSRAIARSEQLAALSSVSLPITRRRFWRRVSDNRGSPARPAVRSVEQPIIALMLPLLTARG